MADAWARVTGEVGVATVHQGPGFTNAVTALAEAAKARTPLLLLAADTSAGRHPLELPDRPGRRSPRRVGAVRRTGRTRRRRRSPTSSGPTGGPRLERRAVVRCCCRSTSRRAEAPALDATPPAASEAVTTHRPARDGRWRPAVDLLVEAPARHHRRAGRGARRRRPVARGAGGPIGAVMATSANGNGLFARQPLRARDLGRLPCPRRRSPARGRPTSSSPSALRSTCGRPATAPWSDRRPRSSRSTARSTPSAPTARSTSASSPTPAETVTDLVAALRARGHARHRLPHRRGRGSEIAAGRWRDEPYEADRRGERIDPRTLSIALDRAAAGRSGSWPIDSGHFMGWPAMYIDVPDPPGFVFTQAFQSIGLGLASAIGAAVARPDRLTVAALGDGGALMAAGRVRDARPAGAADAGRRLQRRGLRRRGPPLRARTANRSTSSASPTPTSPPWAEPSAPTA